MRDKIPTDMQVVRGFMAEAEGFRESAEQHHTDDPRKHIKWGNAEARDALAARLAYVKQQRAERVREAGERLADACENAGRQITQFLNKRTNNQRKEDEK